MKVFQQQADIGPAVGSEREEQMKPEADRILNVFRERGKHTGDLVHLTDFGDAIIWKGGFIQDEATRLVFCEIVQGAYVVELARSLELTAKGNECCLSRPDRRPRSQSILYPHR